MSNDWSSRYTVFDEDHACCLMVFQSLEALPIVISYENAAYGKLSNRRDTLVACLVVISENVAY